MILAAIDFDVLIPLFIAGFWVVAQIMGAVNKTKPPPSKSRPSGESENKDPLAELMRKLSGAEEIKPAPVPRQDVPRPTQQRAAKQPAAPEPVANNVNLRNQYRPRPQTIQEVTTEAPPLQVVTPPPPKPINMQEVEAHPTMRSFKAAAPSMKLPAMNLSFRTSEKSGAGVPRVGKIIQRGDKQALRRAVIGQIVLGKPKGLRPMTDDG